MSMSVIPERFEHASDRAEFRQPTRAGVELYRAHIVRHAFEPHTHEGFGLGVIERGVERFRYAGSEYVAPAGAIVAMNPDELHTGRAGTDQGWRYRMMYIEPAALAEISGDGHWWFSAAVIDRDHTRALRLEALLESLWRATEPLAFDSLLLQFVIELRPHARIAAAARVERAQRFAPVLDYMHAHLGDRIVLDDLAAVAGLSPFHFLRRFREQHHATPQQMLMALRLGAAKRLLALGEAPAGVAAATGLADQAHLTKAFARRYGTTPARYQRQVRA